MASLFGVNVTTGTSASRVIKIESTTPIGIVGYETGASLADGLHYFGSVGAALTALEASTAGTLKDALKDIEAQNVECPIILSVVTEGATEPETVTALIAGTTLLKNSLAEFGIKPNLIVVPEHSHDATVAAEVQSVAVALLATGIVDLDAADESAALTAAGSFGTKRLLLCDPYVTTSRGDRPMSTHVAGMIAATDAAREYGWADSFSNRVMNGVVGTKRTIEFIPGQDCEADRLRGAGITTMIRYSGYRGWGGHTTDIDTIWQSLTRVRIFDRVAEAALEGVFFAIDRQADELLEARLSVGGLLNSLKGAGVLLGFNVYWDPDLNTAENITAGKFYLVAEIQDNPIVTRLEVTFNYTDQYGAVLINTIS